MLKDLSFLIDFIDDLPIGIATADITNKTPNSFNKFFLDLFGWNREDIDTLENWFLKAYPNEEYRNKLIEEWTKLVEETEEKKLIYSKPMEANVTCKDGSVKVCECRYYRKENFMYGIFTDITKQKETEEKLLSLSIIDELTQLYNRKYYKECIHKLLSSYTRYKTPFSIIMYDIDDFKSINDDFSHTAGDNVLIEMSKLMRSQIRSDDNIFRVGGEEFIILLPNTSIEESKKVAEKIRFSVENDLTSQIDKKITISIGLTEVTDEDDESSIFKRVDSYLYFSKRNGKNKVSYSI